MENDNKDVIVVDTPAPEAVVKPTVDEVVKSGWTEKEIASAQKRGLLATAPEPAKPAEGAAPEPEKPEEPAKPEAVVKKPAGGIPDVDLKPEEEALLLKTFGQGHPVRGLYLRMKNERRSRQKLQVEKDAEIAALKAQLAAKDGEHVVLSEDEDPDDKPLTPRLLKEMEQRKEEEKKKHEAAALERRARLQAAHVEQEEYAKALYPDFDNTIELTQDLINNLDDLIPEKWKRDEAVMLMQKIAEAAGNADRLGLEDANGAHLSYRLGQMHPKYGKTDTSKGDPKGNGGLTPEKLSRIEKNTERRPPTAQVADGGGRRTISADDVDLAVLNGMDVKARLAFKAKYPDKYRQILRG